MFENFVDKKLKKQKITNIVLQTYLDLFNVQNYQPSVCFQLARWSRCRWRVERFHCDVTAWPGTSAACFLPCPTSRRPGACQTRAVPPRTGPGPRLTAARRRRGPSPSWSRFRSRSGKFSTTRRRTRICLCLFPHWPEVYFIIRLKSKHIKCCFLLTWLQINATFEPLGPHTALTIFPKLSKCSLKLVLCNCLASLKQLFCFELVNVNKLGRVNFLYNIHKNTIKVFTFKQPYCQIK